MILDLKNPKISIYHGNGSFDESFGALTTENSDTCQGQNFQKYFFSKRDRESTGGFQIKSRQTDGQLINSADSPNNCKIFVGGISKNTNTG